jgi:tRNA A-37 threonylcarbamoyl transferase component Bud32
MHLVMALIKWFKEIPTGIDGTPLPQDRVDTLEQILHEKFTQGYVVESVKRLKSKKNTVISLRIHPKGAEPITLVAKMFIAGRFNNEISILRSSWSHGLAVPEVLEARDDVILMNFIPGETFVDMINQTFEPHLIDKLAEWYYKYHRAHGQIKGDPRLRNFIIQGDQIFGVDFEESREDLWMVDIAGVCASLLDTNPIFDRRKRTLSWRFLEKYLSLYPVPPRDETTHTNFVATIADTLKQTSQWRNDRKILELSEKIRAEGLSTD